MKTKYLFFLLYFTMLHNACDNNSKSESQNVPLNLSNEVSITDIHIGYQQKKYTVVQVTQFYLERIEKMNHNGPYLNAILTVNPDALTIAQELDKTLEKTFSKRPLFGIPIVLKDNIDTRDKMPCTAGARIMAESYPKIDSPLAAQLRAAGAIILGKANLSEWANFHSNQSSSGWSGLGGQTKNPYDLTRNPCGSSAGSGAAVAANLAVLAIGTETNGSIVCPSSHNGIVGIKPTVGLISRTGIIPISFTQDTGGPMARTVKDAAICLGSLTAVDPSDTKTLQSDRKALKDYTSSLKIDGLKGKRIGFFKANAANNEKVMNLFEKAANDIQNAGGEIIPIQKVMDATAEQHSFQVLLYEFKAGLNQYFKTLGAKAPVKNLTDLIEKTFRDSIEMEFHDHQLLKVANEKKGLDEKEYIEAQAQALELSTIQGIDKIMDEHQLDAIIAPAGSPAWKTDLLVGDNYSVYSSSPAAISGYPNICVPMGNIHGMPVGLNIFGRKWSEAALIEIAYAYEQNTKHRFAPSYLNTK